MQSTKINDQYAVGPQIGAGDADAIREAGYRVVICNRPDGEEPGQPTAADIAAACKAAGLSFHHLPFQGANLAPELIDAFREVLDNADGPVFAYCRSGQRCAYLWQNAMTGGR
ncbi:MAG: TIGR01244 family sulfur transferase [Woeseiaceae bacterium]|nr:TIGR01244 family sulfur transferase [Woeseiaceae bacterium]